MITRRSELLHLGLGAAFGSLLDQFEDVRFGSLADIEIVGQECPL
jgi:hypothetical protein